MSSIFFINFHLQKNNNMRIIKDNNVNPICPHCEKELEEVIRISDDHKFFNSHKGYCFVCSKCRKVLGFTDYAQ